MKSTQEMEVLRGGIVGFVPLASGEAAIVDVEMLPVVLAVPWIAARQHGVTYARHNWRHDGKYRKTQLAHVVLGHPLNGLMVDHINGNPLDNRRCNLRIVTARQNSWNRREFRTASKSSKFVGVYWCKAKNKWRAQISIDGRRKMLGSFDTEEAAGACVLAAVPVKDRQFLNRGKQ